MSPPISKKASAVQSILVVHQGALGDFILALPPLETLRKAFPEAKLVMMGYPRILELVERRFYAEEIFSIDQKGMASFFVRDGILDLNLSDFFETFDLIIVFGKDGEGTVMGNLRRVCQGQILHINSFPPWDEKVHLTDHLLKQFAQHGFPASVLNPRLYLKESDRKWAGDFWKRKGVTPEERTKVIVLHPGSGSKKKVWPLDRFLNLAHTLQNHFRSKILIVLGPAEGPEVQKGFEGAGSYRIHSGKGIDPSPTGIGDGRKQVLYRKRLWYFSYGRCIGTANDGHLWSNGSQGLVAKGRKDICGSEGNSLFPLSSRAILSM